MNKTSYFKGVKKTDNYSKQCIATKNKNGEIEVWVNCACSGIAKKIHSNILLEQFMMVDLVF